MYAKGKRYKSEILEVEYKSKNISRVLELSINEAIAFFKDYPRITSKLKILDEVGLGYLRLGQSATTLFRRRGAENKALLSIYLFKRRVKNIIYF